MRSSSSRPCDRRLAARGVERAAQQRARARRLGQRDRAVDRVLADAPVGLAAEVEHRRLREAADDLVRARDDEVGARRERVLGQRLVEGHVRAPRLVDDQRDAAGVRDLGEAARRRPPRRSTSARSPTRRPPPASPRAPRRAPRASGSGRSPARGRARARRTSGAARRARARRSSRSGRCAARPPRRPWWASARPAAMLPCEAPLTRNHVRRAPHASAASRCACSNGVGSAPRSMP